MHDQALPPHDPTPPPDACRPTSRDLVLRAALSKRAAGAPTFSVPEVAALLSVSREHLYRLVRADALPVLQVRLGGDQGRYVIAARTVELLLDAAANAVGRMDITDWANSLTGGAAAEAGA